MTAPRIRLTVPRYIDARIKQASKAAFPKESFGFLLGTVAGDSVQVDDLYIPEGVEEHCTCSSVAPQPEWWADAVEQARESDLTIVGWEHAHPYGLHERKRRGNRLFLDHAQSQEDLDSEFKLLVSCVCIVQEIKRAGRVTLRASLRYWGLTIPLDVTYL